MYTIIGGDGREYGPVPPDQVRAWIAAGRADLDTRAKLLGTDAWKRIGDIPELAAGPAEPAAGPEPALADRLLRLGAALADTVAAMVFALPGAAMVGFKSLVGLLRSGWSGQQPPVSLDPGLAVLGLGMLVLFVIQVLLLSARGQTVGKMLCRIRIVRYRDGAPAGFVHAVLLRSWVPAAITVIPAVGPFFPLADVAFIFGAQRRCIHDLIADTKVVAA